MYPTQHASSAPLLSLQGVTWSTGGRQILGPLSFSVEEGEWVAVIGPNGAGKTSLLRLLTGIRSPAEGGLFFGEDSYQSLQARELALRIAYVPQVRPSRLPLLVEDLVLQGRFPHLSRWQLAPSEEDFQAVSQALETVELEAFRQRPVNELSGGERQAVFIAAALAQKAPVLMLDEPTTHLDPRHQRDIVKLLQRLRRNHRPTVVLATHDLRLAARSDRVLALSGGGILAFDEPKRVLRPEVLEGLFSTPFDIVQLEDGVAPLVKF
ncbi:MAG: ABC transporter ATP-binding protein [Deltaproteobacteria bacterium]|nr:ABC transporter ATP-binding protein [Deltaproteobacteria bacterium]